MKLVHKNELKSKSESNSESIQKKDCERGICKKFYGHFHKKLWCLKCSEMAAEKAKRLKMKTKMRKSENAKQKLIKQKESGITKEKELCPECGSNVPNVKLHIEVNHKIDIQKCPHCDRELMNISKLKAHIKWHHEKTPCVHCGKLVAVEFMTAHLQRQHTSNDDKKYKCDVCGKGFAAKQHFIDHKNIHSGEKPSSASFVQLVLQARGIMECMKDHILVTREYLPNKEFMYSKYRNRHSRIRIFDKSISIRGFTKFDIKVL